MVEIVPITANSNYPLIEKINLIPSLFKVRWDSQDGRLRWLHIGTKVRPVLNELPNDLDHEHLLIDVSICIVNHIIPNMRGEAIIYIL